MNADTFKRAARTALMAATTPFLLVCAVSCGGGGGASSDAAPAGGPAGVSSAGYRDMTVDELRELINADAPPAGGNARSAATSPGVASAAQTYADLEDRGFAGIELCSDFDIEGNYTGMKSLDRASGAKRPSYTAYYTSERGVLWIVYVNDGCYAARPLGGEGGPLAKTIVLSENDYVTQYDGDRNEYSDFELDSLSEAVGLKVQRLDKSTLDTYSVDYLEKV